MAAMMANKSHVDAKEDECDKVGGLEIMVGAMHSRESALSQSIRM